jgi:hypothetical protein
MRLNFIEKLPKEFLDIEHQNIQKLFNAPTLVKIEGEKSPPLFVSILLHGNEYSGLLIMQEILQKYYQDGEYKLPRSLWLFIGNVGAANAGLRTLDDELDFNRAWPGTPHTQSPTTTLISQVMEYITAEGLFAALDLHNNTGKNPHYGCISMVNEPNKYLASYFNHIAMVFKTPKGVSTMAFDDICPAMTLECSTPGNKRAIDRAVELIDDLMHMDHFPHKPLPSHDLQLVRNSATLTIAEGVNFGFEDEEGEFDLTIIANFDRHNFSELVAGEVFAHTTLSHPFKVTANDGKDITDSVIYNDNGAISLQSMYIPAMITLDKRIIGQDCLCYLMEDYCE